jgi:hypothetical protein
LQSQPRTIADLVAFVREHPAPVIFPDTCSVLDILRCVYRDTASPDLAQQTLNALKATSSKPSKLYLVISEQVAQEYARNLPEVLKELQGRISQISQVGSSLLQDIDSAELGSALKSLQTNLTSLTSQIYDSCLQIATDQVCVARSTMRLANYSAPAKRGSTNMGDCLVIEHFLELVQQLRAVKFVQPCIFVSSNHRDFGPAPNPKPPLDSELVALSIDYMPDIAAALAQVGL